MITVCAVPPPSSFTCIGAVHCWSSNKASPSRRGRAANRLHMSTSCELRLCESHDLFHELVPYVQAWRWQKETVEDMCAAVTRGEDPSSSVVLLQHPPVYTMGTRSSDDHLRFDKEHPPFELHRTERGGEVTYHGPGQLVMYPILNLRNHNMDLHWYLRMLEEVVIRAVGSSCGLQASRIDGLTGVWVGDAKIAAIGVRVSRWITYHGLALNVNPDLTHFQNIVPCGIGDRPVGSIRQLLESGEDAQGSDLVTPWSSNMDEKPMMVNLRVFKDARLLQQVHDSLLEEFASVFELQLIHPTKDGPETLSGLSPSHIARTC